MRHSLHLRSVGRLETNRHHHLVLPSRSLEPHMNQRFKELLGRLVAVGNPHSKFSASEFHELHDYAYENDWQEIDTAPKDGTKILIFDGDVHLVSWLNNSHFKDGNVMQWCIIGSFKNDQGMRETVDCPTHWASIPESPFRKP